MNKLRVHNPAICYGFHTFYIIMYKSKYAIIQPRSYKAITHCGANGCSCSIL